jgi:hypothetical protein
VKACKGTQRYFEKCIALKNCSFSKKEITSTEDKWLKNLLEVVSQFKNRKSKHKIELERLSPVIQEKSFISEELYFNLVVTCNLFFILAMKCIKLGIPFIPKIFNQNCVETWFNLQRGQQRLNNKVTVS